VGIARLNSMVGNAHPTKPLAERGAGQKIHFRWVRELFHQAARWPDLKGTNLNGKVIAGHHFCDGLADSAESSAPAGQMVGLHGWQSKRHR
jgi:hypothetical protein